MVKAVIALPARQPELITLRVFLDLDMATAAALLGISRRTHRHARDATPTSFSPCAMPLPKPRTARVRIEDEASDPVSPKLKQISRSGAYTRCTPGSTPPSATGAAHSRMAPSPGP
jgi:hypothetical protein